MAGYWAWDIILKFHAVTRWITDLEILRLPRWHGEQIAGACDIGRTVAIGEQAIVSDAMEAVWPDVDEEAADELVGGERHRLGAGAAVGTIILVPEGDAVLVEGDEPAVGDGDAVGVARQISEHGPPNGGFK